ncbi:hypothetical protein J2799_003690 [Chryseobacterium vietnamense]|uniref:hypothetical protein n=1 Tax=Chryseobacterium vietnamense TaxID=866785 RepID=UPI002866601B|nr:hypothetical protein [Chryseobacterium vietnamense]MDR6489151.1 hypothetical protein [Chryseobacterium vietnamense]
MVLKQLNKIIVLIVFAINTNICSQIKISDIENKKFSINSKTQKQNLVKISDNSDYSIYYIVNRRDFNLKKGLGTNGIAKVIFFSKMYNKGILINFQQMIYRAKTNIYNISLHTGANDKYMFVSSMAVLDKDFNYEYFMKYHYMQSSPLENGGYKSWITIQDTKNYCNLIDIDLRDNVIYENINDILSNIPKIPKENNIKKKCTSIIYDMDLKDFFQRR